MDKKNDQLVPRSQAARMLRTGFEWEAGLFFETYMELKKIMPKEEARDLLQKAMYKAGLKLGQEARELVDRGDIRGIAKAWNIIYGADVDGDRSVRLDDERWILRFEGCVNDALFRRWGLSDEDVCFLGDAYCIGDTAFVKGFSDQIYFQHNCRAMCGDKYCEWDFSMKPLQPSQGAVPIPNIKD